MRLTREIFVRLISYYNKHNFAIKRKKYFYLKKYLKKKFDFEVSEKTIKKHIENWIQFSIN